VKRFEDAHTIGGWHAWPVVAHGQQEAVALSGRGDLNSPSRRRNSAPCTSTS
jgi:hypothetical protein